MTSAAGNRIKAISERLYPWVGDNIGSIFDVYRPNVSPTAVSYTKEFSRRCFIEAGKQGQPDAPFPVSLFHGSVRTQGMVPGDLLVPRDTTQFPTDLTYLSFFHRATEVNFFATERTGALYVNETETYFTGFRYDWVFGTTVAEAVKEGLAGNGSRSIRKLVAWGFPKLLPQNNYMRDLYFVETDGTLKRRWSLMSVEFNHPLVIMTVQEI